MAKHRRRRDKRNAKRALERRKRALGLDGWRRVQHQTRVQRETVRQQREQDRRATAARQAAARAGDARRQVWDERQRQVNAAVFAAAAQVQQREEAQAQRDYDRMHAEWDLPMTGMQWSPSSGRA